MRAIAKQTRRFFSRLAADRRLHRELSLLLGLLLSVFLTLQCSSFAAVAGQVRQDTLRLHVQARSNSPADQLMKLQVRDAVLKQAARIFADCPTQDAARRSAFAALAQMQQAADAVLARAGWSGQARVYLTRMDFATTHYKEFSLPAGTYDALRVELGSARGRNWFCVLYPGLCLPAAEKQTAPAMYPHQAEQLLVTEGYSIRFALLEWCQRLRQWLCRLLRA